MYFGLSANVIKKSILNEKKKMRLLKHFVFCVCWGRFCILLCRKLECKRLYAHNWSCNIIELNSMLIVFIMYTHPSTRGREWKKKSVFCNKFVFEFYTKLLLSIPCAEFISKCNVTIIMNDEYLVNVKIREWFIINWIE